MIMCFYAVDAIEHERGFGQRPDGTIYFEDRKSALEFIKNFSSSTPYNYKTFVTLGQPYISELTLEEYEYIAEKIRNNENGRYYWS